MAAAAVAEAAPAAEHEESGHAAFKMPPKESLISVLLDLSKPIAQRMRCIFYLRTIGGDDAVEALCKALRNKEGSCLFRHEVAYVLGQMLAKTAVPTLSEVLADASDDPIVRHESGEALGAIAAPESLALLEHHCSDPRPEVAETCQIAAKRVRWALESGDAAAEEGNLRDNPYQSVDPAPAAKKPTKEQVPELERTLLDAAVPLFDRYKAMFSLRNNRSRAAIAALCKGLNDASPLFRHEVAYVLGQLAHPASAEALKARVTDAAEHEMVRHEAAEALGAIGDEASVEFLQKYVDDGTLMLRESCVVALDAADYWSSASEGIAAGGAGGEAAAPAAAAAAGSA